MLMAVLESPTCAGRHKCIILCYTAEFWVPSTKCRNSSCVLLTAKSLSPLPKKKGGGTDSMYISMDLYSHGLLF